MWCEVGGALRDCLRKVYITLVRAGAEDETIIVPEISFKVVYEKYHDEYDLLFRGP